MWSPADSVVFVPGYSVIIAVGTPEYFKDPGAIKLLTYAFKTDTPVIKIVLRQDWERCVPAIGLQVPDNSCRGKVK